MFNKEILSLLGITDNEVISENNYKGNIQLHKLYEADKNYANIENEKREYVLDYNNLIGYQENGFTHKQGGNKRYFQPNTMIFSNNFKLSEKDIASIKEIEEKITDKNNKIIPNKEFKAIKKTTPAELANEYDISKYSKILLDSNYDNLEKSTAEIMVNKNLPFLKKIFLSQELSKYKKGKENNLNELINDTNNQLNNEGLKKAQGGELLRQAYNLDFTNTDNTVNTDNINQKKKKEKKYNLYNDNNYFRENTALQNLYNLSELANIDNIYEKPIDIKMPFIPLKENNTVEMLKNNAINQLKQYAYSLDKMNINSNLKATLLTNAQAKINENLNNSIFSANQQSLNIDNQNNQNLAKTIYENNVNTQKELQRVGQANNLINSKSQEYKQDIIRDILIKKFNYDENINNLKYVNALSEQYDLDPKTLNFVFEKGKKMNFDFSTLFQ